MGRLAGVAKFQERMRQREQRLLLKRAKEDQKKREAADPALRYARLLAPEFEAGRLSAEKRGLSWLLSLADYKKLLCTGRCFYCGGRLSDRGVRLDRTNNDEGYYWANVVPCCGKCNKLKGSLSMEDFLARVQSIAIHHNLLDWKRSGNG